MQYTERFIARVSHCITAHKVCLLWRLTPSNKRQKYKIQSFYLPVFKEYIIIRTFFFFGKSRAARLTAMSLFRTCFPFLNIYQYREHDHCGFSTRGSVTMISLKIQGIKMTNPFVQYKAIVLATSHWEIFLYFCIIHKAPINAL